MNWRVPMTDEKIALPPVWLWGLVNVFSLVVAGALWEAMREVKYNMQITQEGAFVRLQLVDLTNGVHLFNFTIEKEAYEEMKQHIIAHLNDFKPALGKNAFEKRARNYSEKSSGSVNIRNNTIM